MTVGTCGVDPFEVAETLGYRFGMRSKKRPFIVFLLNQSTGDLVSGKGGTITAAQRRAAEEAIRRHAAMNRVVDPLMKSLRTRP